MCLISQCHNPTEANISSMSSQSAARDVGWCVVLFLWSSADSLDTEGSVFSLCLFCCFFLTLALAAEDPNLLLSEWKQVLRWAFLLVAAEDRQLRGADPRGDEAQRASCLKVCNFLWTLGMRTNYNTRAQLVPVALKWIVWDCTAGPNKVATECIFCSVALTCNPLPLSFSFSGTLNAGRSRDVFPFSSS